MRLLIIEDNPQFAAALRNGLQEAGFAVDVSHTAAEGEVLAEKGGYDAVILDRMLPDREGLEVCHELRQRECAVPILILSALSQTKHRVTGLEAGADDYLAKPFEFEELVARVRALLRRGRTAPIASLDFDDLKLNIGRRAATRDGTKIKLTAKEFMLLEFLMRNVDRVVTRQQIAESVWDMNYDPESNVIDVYISALRKKIDRDFKRPLIHTEIKAGYRFGLAESTARPD